MLRRVFTPALCCAAAGRSVHCGRAGAEEPSGDRGVGGQGGGLCGPGRAHPRGTQPTHPRRPHPLSTLKPALYPQSQPSGYPQLRSIANPKPLRDQPNTPPPAHPTHSTLRSRPSGYPQPSPLSACSFICLPSNASHSVRRRDRMGRSRRRGASGPGSCRRSWTRGGSGRWRRASRCTSCSTRISGSKVGAHSRALSRLVAFGFCRVWTSSKRLVLAVVGSCF